MTFQNPRLHTTPAERMRARCLLASRFVSSDCVEDNGGTISGSVAVSRGATIKDGGSIAYPTISYRDNYKATLFVKFSAVDEGIATNLFNFGGDRMRILFIDGTVSAYHTDGTTTSDSLALEYDYLDGEEHVVMYAVDIDSGVHTIMIGDEMETGETDVTGSIAQDTTTFYGIEEHAVYKALLFNDYLDADDFSILSDEDWANFIDTNLFALWRCNDARDDTTGNYIRDSHGDKKITKGDGSTSSTFPTFTGDNDDEIYNFESTSYLSAVPALPDAYTLSICSSDRQYTGRYLSVAQGDTDDSLLDEMTTAGGFTNDNLHNIYVSDRELLAIEKLHLEYKQKQDYWRSSCRSAIHGLINEGHCRVAMLFNCPLATRNIASDSSSKLGVKTGTNTSAAEQYIQFLNTDSRIDLTNEAGDEKVQETTIVSYFDNLAYSGSVRTMASKGSLLNFYANTGSDQLVLNASSIIDPRISDATGMFAVSATYGYKPRFFVDDLYIGEGGSNVTLTNADNSVDWKFGNNVTNNLPFENVDAKAFLVFDVALTDQEVMAIYYSLKNSFEYAIPAGVTSEVWNDTTTSTEIKNDTTTSTDVINDRVL